MKTLNPTSKFKINFYVSCLGNEKVDFDFSRNSNFMVKMSTFPYRFPTRILFGCCSGKFWPLIPLELRILTYFDALITNLILKISASSNSTFPLKPFFTKKNKIFQKWGIWNTWENWNSCTEGSTGFFTPSKLEHTPMKESTPSPSTEVPVFSHTFQTGTHPNERRHPFPLYRSPRFFAHLPNWNTPQWKKAPLHPLPKLPFFHFLQDTFQWMFPLYRNSTFLTCSKYPIFGKSYFSC